MRIGGHGLREHLRVLAPSFGLIGAVWMMRLVLDASGAPASLVRIFSVSVSGPLAVFLGVLLFHIKRFGSYTNVVAAAFLLTCWQQLLIAAAIAFSALTGTINIFSAPEYSGPGLGPAQHIAGHLSFGVGIGTLFGSATGCLLFWLLHTLAPPGGKPALPRSDGLPGGKLDFKR